MAEPNDCAEPPGFAPSDLTDGRKELDWRTRYEPEARRAIRFELGCLILLLVLLPAAIVLVWLGELCDVLNVAPGRQRSLEIYAEAWLAGALGGAVFSTKWLIHVVAHSTWNLDRRPWRFCTPLVSGSVAFALMAIVTSDVFRVLDRDVLTTGSAVVGISFLLGYFSDGTIAKLANVAENLLGETNTKRRTPDNSSPPQSADADNPPEHER